MALQRTPRFFPSRRCVWTILGTLFWPAVVLLAPQSVKLLRQLMFSQLLEALLRLVTPTVQVRWHVSGQPVFAFHKA